MLHGDIFVLHGLRLVFRGGEGRVYIGGNIEFVSLPAAGHAGNLCKLRLGGGVQAFHRNAHFLQQLGNQTALLPQQRQQQVNLLHLLVMIAPGDVLRVLHRLQGLLRIVIEIHKAHSFRAVLPRG